MTTPLEVGETLKLRANRHNEFISTNLRNGGLGEEETLEAWEAKTIHPNEYYWNDSRYPDESWQWNQRWSGGKVVTAVNLEVEVVDLKNRHIESCVKYDGQYFEVSWLCDLWQVPDGWSSGEPLTHLSRNFLELYKGDDRESWEWSNRKGIPPVSADSLKTTEEPINQYGVSGAVLAAMFDAWTPRAAGMRALPGFASAVKGALDPTPVTSLPYDDVQARVSVYHESRANAYADGASNVDTYSPAVGSYLYAFRSGAWKRSGEPRSVSALFEQHTMAMHLNYDPHKGLTLPRWVGLHELGLDEKDGHQIWLYQGEQLGHDKKRRVIAPNDLLLFGKTVHYWLDIKPEEGYSPSTVVAVSLSVEKSMSDPRSVDLCWTSYTKLGYQWNKNCTTWIVPEGWVPGQMLKPHSYQVAKQTHARNWLVPFYWSTRAPQ